MNSTLTTEELKARISNEKSKYSMELAAARVSIDELISEEQQIVKIAGKPAFTYGNISVILGKAKSKKSYLVSIFAVALLSGKFGTIDGFLGSHKRLLWFDTEQSRFHVHRLLRRIKNLTGRSFPNMEIYCLRPYTPEERVRLIEAAMVGDVGMVIIDGIRDLVYDINDPQRVDQHHFQAFEVVGRNGLPHLECLTR